MAKLVSDFILDRLHEWGITRIFGFPGDGIGGLIGALDRAKDKIDFVQVRHEEDASFMACAHSKFTGEVGVCMATSGPGAIHLLNGLYDAKMDHQSVVAIVGQSSRMALGGDYQQEVDLMSLYKDVAKDYVHTLTTPEQAQQLVDRAIRIARARRTVTCIIVPNDVQELDAKTPPRKHNAIHTGIGFPREHIVPSESELKRTADLLNEGEKVAMLVGAGALNASEEVKEVAELLGAGVAKALLGRAVVSDDLPYVTGAIGLLGTKPSWEMMTDCDTLLMVGSSFPYSEFLPEVGQARGVQVDIDGRMLSLRYPMEINLLGDSKETLRALIPFLKYKKDRSWRNKIEDDIKDWWEVIEARAMDEANPVNPQRVFWELSPKLPENCILSSDSGSSANWFARNLIIKEGMMASLSGNLATMCPGVPYAIAAKFAYPERVSIALVGDGAMQMMGNNGLITISKYWKRWKDPRLVIMVLHNNDLNQVSWEQRVLAGDPKFPGSQDVPDFPYAQYAELLGLKGVRVDNPDDLSAAWDVVLSADRPAVLEVITDPDVPTIPPHISFDMMVKYSKTLLKGDPDEAGIVRQTWNNVKESVFH
ncbi:MAG TPA: thiamine pyrophosphate-requiring protein [Hanamia sp.]|nr:thiamine pyrophosphate-requiring protein [Hanamia sp.]